MESKTSKRRVEALQRRKTAMIMRMEGHSLAAIGEQLGVTHQAVSVMIAKQLESTLEELKAPTEELRSMEVERIDEIVRSIQPQLLDPDPRVRNQTVDRLLRVMERRAKLLGLDAPVRTEVAGPDGGPIEVQHSADSRYAIEQAILIEGDN